MSIDHNNDIQFAFRKNIQYHQILPNDFSYLDSTHAIVKSLGSCWQFPFWKYGNLFEIMLVFRIHVKRVEKLKFLKLKVTPLFKPKNQTWKLTVLLVTVVRHAVMDLTCTKQFIKEDRFFRLTCPNCADLAERHQKLLEEQKFWRAMLVITLFLFFLLLTNHG